MHQVAGYKVIEQTSISESQWFDNFILTIVVRLKPSIISNIRILSFCLKSALNHQSSYKKILIIDLLQQCDHLQDFQII